MIGPQQSHGMRIEREHHGRSAHPASLRQQPLDNPRMASMHAVEISDGHRAAADGVGQIEKIAQQFHDINLPHATAGRQLIEARLQDPFLHGVYDANADSRRRKAVVCAILVIPHRVICAVASPR